MFYAQLTNYDFRYIACFQNRKAWCQSFKSPPSIYCKYLKKSLLHTYFPEDLNWVQNHLPKPNVNKTNLLSQRQLLKLSPKRLSQADIPQKRLPISRQSSNFIKSLYKLDIKLDQKSICLMSRNIEFKYLFKFQAINFSREIFFPPLTLEAEHFINVTQC